MILWLLQECLLEGKLDTAASYLIILQNLEQPIVARQVCMCKVGEEESGRGARCVRGKGNRVIGICDRGGDI